MSGEQIFLKEPDAFVSTARIIINKKTYATSNVTSVSSLVKKPKRFWPIIMVLFGGLALLGSFGSSDSSVSGISFFVLLVGVLWLVLVKTDYILMLLSSSGEHQALVSKDSGTIERIVQAINEAIVARG